MDRHHCKTRLHATIVIFSLAALPLTGCATSDLGPLEEGDSGQPDMWRGARDMSSPPATDMRAPSPRDMRPAAPLDMNMSSPDLSGDDMAREPDLAPPEDMSMERPCQQDNQCLIGTYCDTARGYCASDCLDHPDCQQDEICDTTRGRCEVHVMDCGNGVCDSFEDCETCAEDCGCGDRQVCSQGVCTCQDECVADDSECVGNGVRTCSADSQGCLRWPAPTPCNGGCVNDMCACQAACGGAECGMDGCGGSCGVCTFSCDGNSQCMRQLTINYVQTDCDAECQDVFDPTDPYIEVFIGGSSYDRDEGARDRCDMVRTAENWIVGGAGMTFSLAELQQVTLEVKDSDSFNSDDMCAEWIGIDLSSPGTQTLVSADGKVTVSLTVTR